MLRARGNAVLQQQRKVMGGSSSKHGRRENHFFFGEVIRKKNFNKQVIIVTKPILNREEYDEWKGWYDQAHDMNKDALLIPEGYEYHKLQKSVGACNCCGAEGETEMTYEDTAFSLHQEIANRKPSKRTYNEEELMLLLYSLLQGAKEFQRMDMHVGDIRTKNILITKGSDVKMVNVVSFPGQKTAVDKILDRFDNTTIFFLAPQEVEHVKSQGYSKGIPNAYTQAWAVGLCVLEAATLENSETLYEMPGRKIKQDLLKDRLRESSTKYKTLHHYLQSILRVNPSQRMSSGQCWASMRPYSQQIMELKKFKREPTTQNESIRKFMSGGSGRK